MTNSIDEIQRQYMYKVQPVQMFETKNSQATQKSSFNFLNQTNNSQYNLSHPNMSNSTSGKKLDFMS